MRRLAGILATAVVIGFGVLTLFGLLLDTPLLADPAQFFLQLVSITIAITIIIGIFNLLTVHLARISRRQTGWGYSLVLVISTLAVFVLTILERVGVLRTEPAVTTILLEQVQVAIESALAGLLLFGLVYGAYRTLRKRVSGWGLLFVLALLVVLAGALPLPYLAPLASVREWLMAVPVSAGARGILLGIALATIVTGIRVLIGQDRSYRE
ncbi:MAG: hypothetical protein CL610_12310 [Anaerolineaceae bacterium]|nr:hypothetical protein [Anaerolineaceae bacterium]